MTTITRFTKEQLIEDLKTSTQNACGMFEIGEETICALMSMLTAPPAPVSVPTFDEWLEIRGNKPLGWVKDAMRESYDACRAAMLQGSQPVSNRDELPSREHFISLCDEFWNWSEMDIVCADDRGYELRMEWNGTVFTHPVTQALWRIYQAKPGNYPVIGWLRSDYNSDDKRDPNAPLFMLGSNDPSEVWGVKYLPLSGNSPVIPQGYVLVPVEPTPEMLRAGFLAGENYPGGVYRAMIAAAPQQEGK